jgi:DUF1680 family protein
MNRTVAHESGLSVAKASGLNGDFLVDTINTIRHYTNDGGPALDLKTHQAPIASTRRQALLAATAGGVAMVVTGKSRASVPQVKQTGLAINGVRPMACYEFDLADIRMLQGPFHDNMVRDQNYMLAFDCDRLLAPFQKIAGLPTKAPNLGGWESAGLASHFCGHFLSAASMMYSHTRDARLLDKIDYLLPRLAQCQRANGKRHRQFRGYCTGIPGSKVAFRKVLAGHINVGNPQALFTFSLNGMWSPWYTVHKIMAGLRDVYLHTGRTQARDILIGMTQWASQFPQALTPGQMQTMLISEQGGMNEVIADVYAITGDKAYLKLAEQFNEKSQLDPLMRRKDILTGTHSNQYIPRVIGLARQYELSGKRAYRTGSEFFWENVARHRTFVFGGNSNHEYFFPLGDAWQQLSVGSAESCCTYNILKLTNHYFCWNATMEAADFFERGLVNHILGSQDPATGMMTYYMSMRPGHFKTFCTAWDSCWCCVGTGMENHAKYAQGIYYHNADTLWINVYMASELNWKGKGMKVRQTTRFPNENSVRMDFACQEPTYATIKLRHPYWSTPAMRVTLNGKAINAGDPGTYLDVSRQWTHGDVLEVQLQTPLRIERMEHHPTKFALLAGPTVLAAVLGNDLMLPPAPYANGDQYEWAKIPDPATIPVMVPGDQPVAAWVKPDAVEPLVWHIHGAGRPMDVKLVPFHKVAHERYVVYFDELTEAQWQQQQASSKAEAKLEKELSENTVDHFQPGIAMSEQRHNLSDVENSDTGNFAGRSWRDARNGGGFSFKMKVLPNKPMGLLMTFWGSDTAGRVFDVLVDGQIIATETLNNNHPGKFFHRQWTLPARITENQTYVTVRLQAHSGMMAGGIFGCRTLKLR